MAYYNGKEWVTQIPTPTTKSTTTTTSKKQQTINEANEKAKTTSSQSYTPTTSKPATTASTPTSAAGSPTAYTPTASSAKQNAVNNASVASERAAGTSLTPTSASSATSVTPAPATSPYAQLDAGYKAGLISEKEYDALRAMLPNEGHVDPGTAKPLDVAPTKQNPDTATVVRNWGQYDDPSDFIDATTGKPPVQPTQSAPPPAQIAFPQAQSTAERQPKYNYQPISAPQYQASVEQTATSVDDIKVQTDNIINQYKQGTVEQQAALAAQLTTMQASIDQMEQRIMSEIHGAINGDDPAMRQAFAILKEEFENSQKSVLEEMNAKGILQSGQYAKAMVDMNKGYTSAESGILAQRFGELQNRLFDTMYNMGMTRMGMMQSNYDQSNALAQSSNANVANMGMQGVGAQQNQQQINNQVQQYYDSLNAGLQGQYAALNQQGQFNTNQLNEQAYQFDASRADNSEAARLNADVAMRGQDYSLYGQLYGTDAQVGMNTQNNAVQLHGIDSQSADNRYATDANVGMNTQNNAVQLHGINTTSADNRYNTNAQVGMNSQNNDTQLYQINTQSADNRYNTDANVFMNGQNNQTQLDVANITALAQKYGVDANVVMAMMSEVTQRGANQFNYDLGLDTNQKNYDLGISGQKSAEEIARINAGAVQPQPGSPEVTQNNMIMAENANTMIASVMKGDTPLNQAVTTIKAWNLQQTDPTLYNAIRQQFISQFGVVAQAAFDGTGAPTPEQLQQSGYTPAPGINELMQPNAFNLIPLGQGMQVLYNYVKNVENPTRYKNSNGYIYTP